MTVDSFIATVGAVRYKDWRIECQLIGGVLVEVRMHYRVADRNLPWTDEKRIRLDAAKTYDVRMFDEGADLIRALLGFILEAEEHEAREQFPRERGSSVRSTRGRRGSRPHPSRLPRIAESVRDSQQT